jgi:hypothetical protein
MYQLQHPVTFRRSNRLSDFMFCGTIVITTHTSNRQSKCLKLEGPCSLINALCLNARFSLSLIFSPKSQVIVRRVFNYGCKTCHLSTSKSAAHHRALSTSNSLPGFSRWSSRILMSFLNLMKSARKRQTTIQFPRMTIKSATICYKQPQISSPRFRTMDGSHFLLMF